MQSQAKKSAGSSPKLAAAAKAFEALQKKPAAAPTAEVDYYRKAEILYQKLETDTLLKLAKEKEFQLMNKLLSNGESNTILSSGMNICTAKDKIDATVFFIDRAKETCLKYLEILVELVKDHNKKSALMALEKIKTVFCESLKEPINSCKLFVVDEHKKSDDATLIKAYLSHKLKLLMEKFQKNLDILLDDPIAYYRKGSLDLLMALAKKLTYFQKQTTVSFIVNKIGDSEKMITGEVQKYIGIAVRNYPQLGKVILESASMMLGRPNLPDMTRYAVITCLANLNFEGSQDQTVISQCNEIFMKEFISNCTTKDESLSKIMNQCLRGLNKNLPHIKDKTLLKKFYEEHTTKLFSMSHMAKLKVRVQILLLIFQLLKTEVHGQQFDRLMKVIYETLLDPSSLHSSITELFLELLFNALKTDQSRVREYEKCANEFTSSNTRFVRVIACLKRLLQNAIHAESNVIIAVLIFVNRLAKSITGLNQTLKNSFARDFGNDDEDDETGAAKKAKDTNGQNADEGFVIDNGGYDFMKRDPLHSKADASLLWELKFFEHHYHPTVRKFAGDLLVNLANPQVDYASNPLLDFTAAAFLDRLCMKKPKVTKGTGKKKLIELRICAHVELNKISRAKVDEPFSLQAVLDEQRQASVREDEQHLLTFFKNKVQSMDYVKVLEKRRQQKGGGMLTEDDADRIADEIFERELEKAEGGRPDPLDADGEDVEGDSEALDDEVDDEELEGLEDADDDEDGGLFAGVDEEFEAEHVNLKPTGKYRGRAQDEDDEPDAMSLEDDGMTLKKRKPKFKQKGKGFKNGGKKTKRY